MQTLTRHVRELGLANRVFTDAQLARTLSGSDQRRYDLVSRALKAGELVRLRRGLYLLSQSLRDYPVHPFAVAQSLVPGSYVSFETALAYHGWIPEAVFTVTSVTPGRKSSDHEHFSLGHFTFRPVAIQPGHFLELVKRERINEQSMLVAQPIRALMDWLCLKKVEWRGLAWLRQNLRIEDERLRQITGAETRTLKLVYKHKRMLSCLDHFAKALGND